LGGAVTGAIRIFDEEGEKLPSRQVGIICWVADLAGGRASKHVAQDSDAALLPKTHWTDDARPI
jgi:hypothetical protein